MERREETEGERTGVGVEFGVVKVFDYGGDGFDGTVPGRIQLTVSVSDFPMKALSKHGAKPAYILKFPPTKNFRAMSAV